MAIRWWVLLIVLALSASLPWAEDLEGSATPDEWSDSEELDDSELDDELETDGSEFDLGDWEEDSALAGIDPMNDEELKKLTAQFAANQRAKKTDIKLEEKLLNNLSTPPAGACTCYKRNCDCPCHHPEFPFCWKERVPKTCSHHEKDRKCVKWDKKKYCVAKDKKRICEKYKGGCSKWKRDKVCIKYKNGKTTTSKKCSEWRTDRRCAKWKGGRKCLKWKTEDKPGKKKCVKWKKNCKTTKECGPGGKTRVCTKEEEKRECKSWTEPVNIPPTPKKCDKYENTESCEEYVTKKECKNWKTEKIPGACTTSEPKKECKEYETKKTCLKHCEKNCKNEDQWGLIWAEPHIETLDGHDYNFVWMGDYWLLKPEGTGLSLKAQVRSSPAHRKGERLHGTIFSAFAAQLGDDVVEMYAKDLTFLLNGKSFDPHVPKKLADGSRIVRNGRHEVSIVSGHVAILVKFVATERGKGEENILDINVRVGKKDAGGFVGVLGNVNGKEGDYRPEDHIDDLRVKEDGLFSRKYTPPTDWKIWTDEDVTKMSPKWQEWAAQSCKAAALKGRRLAACKYDLLVTGSKQFVDVERNAQKQLTKDVEQFGPPGIAKEAKKLKEKAQQALDSSTTSDVSAETPSPIPSPEPVEDGEERSSSSSEEEDDDDASWLADPDTWRIASSVADIDEDNHYQQANYKPRFALSEAHDASVTDLLEDWERDDDAEKDSDSEQDAGYQYCKVPAGAKSEADREMKKAMGVCVTTSGSGRHVCVGDLMPKKGTYKCGSKTNRKCCVSNDQTNNTPESRAKLDKAENGMKVTMTKLWCGRNVKCSKKKCGLGKSGRHNLCRVGPLRLINGKWFSMRWKKTSVRKCEKVCCKDKEEKVCKEWKDVGGQKQCQPDVEKKVCEGYQDVPTEECKTKKTKKKCTKWIPGKPGEKGEKKCKEYKTEKVCKKYEEKCTKMKSKTTCERTDECEEWKESPGSSGRICVKWGPNKVCTKWKNHKRCKTWTNTSNTPDRVCIDWKTTKTCITPTKKCDRWKTVVTCTKERINHECIQYKTFKRCTKWTKESKEKCITIK